MTLDRRQFLAGCSQAGITSALLPGVLYTLAAQAQEAAKPAESFHVTDAMLEQAAALVGGPLTAEQRKTMFGRLESQRKSYEVNRKLKLPNSVAPAFVFDPLPPGAKVDTAKKEPRYSEARGIAVPANLEELAFASVRQLAELIRTQ